MPYSKITGVIVSHVWDDDNIDEYKINVGEFSDTGPYVSVSDDDQVVHFRRESWPEIRDQIDSMFDAMAKGRESE